MAVTLDNILPFLSEVQSYFTDQPHLYSEFMTTIRQHAVEEIGTHELLGQISQLFKGHPFLIHKFVQLLPPGMTLENYSSFCSAAGQSSFVQQESKQRYLDRNYSVQDACSHNMQSTYSGKLLGKRPVSGLADVAKYGTYEEFALFDKVRQMLGNEETYLNFLRCLTLYINDLVSGSELLEILQPFIFKQPEVGQELRRMLRCDFNKPEVRAINSVRSRKTSNSVLDIDYASCKKYGTSYRALPSSFEQPKCTGRTLPGNEVCNEVLNDTWVSFPLWSEDSTFGNSKISQYEEFLYRCEDERFELDIVIDNVTSTVRILEDVQTQMTKMTAEELTAFQLDSCLGGTSEILQRKSIERIYGDKAVDMIEGLVKKPFVAVPIVLRRLKAKLEEWHDAQKNFNKLWRDQCEKNHCKWLQSQAAAYRQVDSRQMRTKTLLNEAETASEELQVNGNEATLGRSLEYVFDDKLDMREATSLIIHYLSYLPTGQTDESFRISQFLLDTLPQLIDIPSTAEPTSRHKISGEIYTLMYTNASWYLFLRLYHLFCKRLKEIHQLAHTLQRENGNLQLESATCTNLTSYYDFIMNTIRGMIEGTVDMLVYENELRKVLGAKGCITFTVEKILQNIVRQLQHLMADDNCKDLMELFRAEQERGGAGGSVDSSHKRQLAEAAYRHRAISLLSEEYCFKIVFYKYEGRIVMELVDTEIDGSLEDQLVSQHRMSTYLEQFVDVSYSPTDQLLDAKPVFLARNLTCTDTNDTSKLSIAENVHCKFASNSFKMSFVANSSSYLYRPQSLNVARQCQSSLSEAKRQKFSGWLSEWKSRNVSTEQDRRCRDWLVRPTRRTFRPRRDKQ